MAGDGNQSGRAHVVMLSTPGMGHVIPAADLAVRLAAYHGLSVTLLTFSNFDSPAQAAFLASLPSDAAVSSVSLPFISLDDLPPDSEVEVHLCALLGRCPPLLRDAFVAFERPVAAYVCDLFGAETLSLARELGVPGYIFFPSDLTMLTLALHLPRLDEATDVDFQDLPDPVRLPGCVPIRGTDFPDPFRQKSGASYAMLVRIMSKYGDAVGILANSFEEMEPEVLKAIREEEEEEEEEEREEFVGRPPVHLVGPMVRSGSDETDESGCLEWLDRQPAGSVLFVSLGSAGTLSSEQMREMALGLEASGQRFLWVVRCPSDIENNAAFFTSGCSSRGILGEDQGRGPRGSVVGAAGEGAGPRRDRRLLLALRLELDPGEHRARRADDRAPALRRAALECRPAHRGRRNRHPPAGEGALRRRRQGGDRGGRQGIDAGGEGQGAAPPRQGAAGGRRAGARAAGGLLVYGTAGSC